MTKRKRNLILMAIAVVLISWIGWHYHSKGKADGPPGGMPPGMVSTVQASMQGWQQQLQATGTLNAEQGVMLKAEVAGRITKILFKSGDNIKTGDPLFEINPAILQAQYLAAQAQADLNTGDYKRAFALYKRGALSTQDLETALANQNAAVANAQAIKAQLTQNIFHAPFDGRLGLRLFNLGDYIDVGQSLVNLQALDPLRVDFTVPENIAGQVRIGDKVQLTSSAYPNRFFTGQVSAIDSAIDTSTRTLAVRALVPNPQQLLLPGNFVQVILFAGQPRPMVTIPQTAVVYDAIGNYVYRVINGRALKTDIVIAEQNNDQVAIKSGLKKGDMVVNAGQLKVMDGASVIVIPDKGK